MIKINKAEKKLILDKYFNCIAFIRFAGVSRNFIHGGRDDWFDQ